MHTSFPGVGGGGVGWVYEARGNVASWDYQTASFTRNGSWHTLDISAKVPAGTKAVLCRFYARANAVDHAAGLGAVGLTAPYASAGVSFSVINRWVESSVFCPVDDDGKIGYYASGSQVIDIYLAIIGWWILG